MDSIIKCVNYISGLVAIEFQQEQSPLLETLLWDDSVIRPSKYVDICMGHEKYSSQMTCLKQVFTSATNQVSY